MITLRPARQRGRTEFDWLESHHTFSFGDYQDPAHSGFRHLRVINEDRVKPGRGFGWHGHRDMEILSFVLEGAVEHKDSLGNGSVIRPGDVQRMSAGTGVTHSEVNPSNVDPVHFLQVWILPERTGLDPGYEQRSFPPSERRGRLLLVASPDGRDGSLLVHQDAQVFAGRLEPNETIEHRLAPERHAWVQIAGGRLTLNGMMLAAGDGAAISGEDRVALRAVDPTDLLLFDLA